MDTHLKVDLVVCTLKVTTSLSFKRETVNGVSLNGMTKPLTRKKFALLTTYRFENH